MFRPVSRNRPSFPVAPEARPPQPRPISKREPNAGPGVSQPSDDDLTPPCTQQGVLLSIRTLTLAPRRPQQVGQPVDRRLP
ncbi:hypothetical protein [Streptomyces sp. NPDC007205]|uniref:hypothetical protein n=1 Tax=Streptomyces sp. NPDC007205 TaxID=3154316 RepID=UPI00340B8501